MKLDWWPHDPRPNRLRHHLRRNRHSSACVGGRLVARTLETVRVQRGVRYKRGYSVRCRHRNCRLYGHRFHRAKHPDQYVIRKWAKCPACDGHLCVDKYRSSGKEAKDTTCSCHGYPFNHRRGSLFCSAGSAGSAGFVYAGPESARMFAENVGAG